MRQMKSSKEPVVLTVNGEAALAVEDADSDQEPLELKERAETVAVLRQRLSTMKQTTARSAEKFFKEFFAAKIR
jgi:hypothetical protein